MTKVEASSARYNVSQEMFAILSEAIHLHSDKMLKFQTLRTIVELCSVRLSDYQFDAEHFQVFIRSVPISGRVRIHLRVETCINDRLTAMKVRLEEICGFPVADRTAIAYFVQIGIENNLY